jgi:hypothetical protein
MRACTLAFFFDLESDWLNRWNSLENMGEGGGRRVFFFFFKVQQNDDILFRFFRFYFLL